MLRDFLAFVFAWYNLPFTVLFGMGILLAALQLIGLSGGDDSGDADHGADVDHGFDHDADIDHGFDHGADVDHGFDHDADIDHGFEHDADIDHGFEHDADIDHGLEHDAGFEHATDLEQGVHLDHAADQQADGASSGFSLLAFLGAGKAPLMVVLLLLFESVALLGWLLNGLVHRLTGVYPSPALFAVLPTALVMGMLVTARTARWLGRALPPISTTASRARTLVGVRGTVISPFVDEQYGMVHLRDVGGTLITVFAVVQNEAAIKRGSEVVLLTYDPVQRRYVVTLAQPSLSSAGR